MATGGRKLVYEEDDKVDEYLLNQLSKWVLYHRLGALARDLGISQAEFSRIAIATNQPDEQIFKVMQLNIDKLVLNGGTSFISIQLLKSRQIKSIFLCISENSQCTD